MQGFAHRTSHQYMLAINQQDAKGLSCTTLSTAATLIWKKSHFYPYWKCAKGERENYTLGLHQVAQKEKRKKGQSKACLPPVPNSRFPSLILIFHACAIPSIRSSSGLRRVNPSHAADTAHPQELPNLSPVSNEARRAFSSSTDGCICIYALRAGGQHPSSLDFTPPGIRTSFLSTPTTARCEWYTQHCCTAWQIGNGNLMSTLMGSSPFVDQKHSRKKITTSQMNIHKHFFFLISIAKAIQYIEYLYGIDVYRLPGL